MTALLLQVPLSGARPSTPAITSHPSAPQPVRPALPDTGHSPEPSPSGAQQEFQVCRPGVQTGMQQDSGSRAPSALLSHPARPSPPSWNLRPLQESTTHWQKAQKEGSPFARDRKKGQVLGTNGHPVLPVSSRSNPSLQGDLSMCPEGNPLLEGAVGTLSPQRCKGVPAKAWA